MALLLGVDTGGTYTDAVIIEDEKIVMASAKSLTTREDLAIGIGKAVEAVLAESGVQVSQIGMASLSTTLATNALVEGQGERVGLVYIGFREQDLKTHGLSDALGSDPALVLGGGHNHAGSEKAPFDQTALSAWLDTDLQVSGFAIAAQFATRNPSHELLAADIIREKTGRPVSLSHHLSAKLNGPKRALTAVLNARLIGMIARLINRAEGKLRDLGINAPLMVVRGDGALISADQARERPIETILSGPAASIVGARWMTGADHALVSDIGGTTTDVALLRDGKPKIDPAGARVGPWRTMVEAVAMRTTGLGGDSEVHVIDEGLTGGLTLGPRRVIPVSLIASQAPDVVLPVLEEQLRSDTPGEHDTRFVRAVPGVDAGGLAAKDAALLERIGDQVSPLASILKSRLENSALKRLVARGLVQVSGVTPSDASHALGRADAWNGDAARQAIRLIARKRTGSGDRLAETVEDMAQMIIDQLTHQTSLALLESAFAEEDTDFGLSPATLAQHVLMQKGLDQHRGLLRFDAGLNLPVVGLGASAPTYYPAVGNRVGTQMILPRHAGVANAVGAVVGRVSFRRAGTITAPAEGRFRVHLDSGPEDFVDAEQAMTVLENHLTQEARKDAREAGAQDINISATRDIRTAKAEAREVFLEAEIMVEASGRARIAS